VLRGTLLAPVGAGLVAGWLAMLVPPPGLACKHGLLHAPTHTLTFHEPLELPLLLNLQVVLRLAVHGLVDSWGNKAD
jgi:hypothetical protein